MTDEHKKIQIAAEIKRGEESLRAADGLLGLQLYNDAVSRFYYAVFHFASATLLSVDISAKSHRALITLFSEHLVLAGKFSPRHVSQLRSLQGLRESADYDRSFSFDEDGANDQAAIARRLIDDFRAYLKNSNWF